MNHPTTPPEKNQLRLIAWEMTRSCPLKCVHCRAGAGARAYDNEFTTEECEKLLTNVASFASPIIIMTGGEPMMRPDIYHLAKFGTSLGLRMVMAPCGMLLTEDACRKLIDAGIKRISLSVDGATAASHDAFRGVDGAFDGVMKAIEAARATGLEFQINTTVTKLNTQDLPAIFDMALKMCAVSFHPFLLVPVGRAGSMRDQEIPPQEYERVLNWIYDHRDNPGMTVKPTCAPHYYRILRQREKAAGRSVTPQTHGLDAMTKGCLGGQGFAFISHVGRVQMCGFMENVAGDVREAGFDFGKIWRDSEFFATIRDLDGYHGRCGICEYRKVCGGCRARASAMTGDPLGEEPFCVYQPQSGSHTGASHAHA
jgi:heme b synthase